ncbi:MAG: RnfH family protein [Gammaproteobacteria bacterium HGW-Gammaproteobacteria-8]|nr:MAG: RnfH family protein [Gammaproteobacteria bacterium HGW-Gammaproteobacteria-8]
MAAESERTLRVEVAVAWPELQLIVPLELPVGSSLADAIAKSGLRERFPELQIDPGRVGVFAEKRSLEDELADGDRVEIYRPLKVDPKEARRKAAAAD